MLRAPEVSLGARAPVPLRNDEDDTLCQKNQVGAGVLSMGTHKVSGVYWQSYDVFN